MPLKYPRPKGTHDLYPGAPAWEDDSLRCHYLEDIFRGVSSLIWLPRNPHTGF